MTSPFHLVTELTERADLAQGIPKRKRTRLALLAATAREMERGGYDGLTVDNIVQQARLARGTFYLYFANRSEAAAAVMRAYRALIRLRRPRGGSRLGRFETILRMNRFYVATYARNAAVLAGVESLVRESSVQALSRDFWNDQWARGVLADALHRSGQPAPADEARALLAIRAVLAMADELLREVYIYRAPAFAAFLDDEDTVVEVLSILWHRAVYGVHPEGQDPILPMPPAGGA